MRTLSTGEVATESEAMGDLPEGVQEALGELAGAAKERLLALSVGVGLVSCASSWRPTTSSARRAGTTAIVGWCITAMRAAG